MREGWKTTTWGDLATLEYGKSLRDYQAETGEVPVYGTNGPIGFTDKSLCHFPSVIIGRKGAYRGVHYSDKPFFVIDTAFYLKPITDRLDLKFAYYQLLTQDINSMDSGSAIPSTSREDFYNLQLKLPPLETQRRIAAILSALDEKIELNRQTNRTLETIAQVLFKEWFVDFNFPGATGEMQESELGPIPVGWRVGKLEEVCELNPRLSLKKGAVAKYIEMKNLSQSSLSIEEPREREFTSGSKFQNGDTLLARITPCLENGKTGFVDFLYEQEVGWGSTEFIVLRGKETVGPYFIYCLSRLASFREFAIQSMVGSSGRQRVVESILSDYQLVIPNRETINIFAKKAKELFNLVKINSEQAATLSQIRDNLLPKLMSGEIDV